MYAIVQSLNPQYNPSINVKHNEINKVFLNGSDIAITKNKIVTISTFGIDANATCAPKIIAEYIAIKEIDLIDFILIS